MMAVVDTSGAGSVYGAPVLKGMLLAAAEINARGGVDGHTLNLRSAMAGLFPRALPRSCDKPAMMPAWLH
jgi:hypothetical protein